MLLDVLPSRGVRTARGAARSDWELKNWGAGPRLAVVGPGGSHALARAGSTTLRRAAKLARCWGYSGVTLADLGMPAASSHAAAAAPGVLGLGGVLRLAAEHDLIVLAWGTQIDPDQSRAVAAQLWRALARGGGSLGVLGWTPGGQPCEMSWQLCGSVIPQCLTAGAHRSFADVDRHWAQLLWVPEAGEFAGQEGVR
ncbi:MULTISPECIES: DUF1643 domain-containing protein [Mycobacterium]|uniref:DUF1643 domain-containing protein n=2 Tax=Mycobacteriaceae TaxID=1762 RepID=A0ABQ1CFZ0_9MYCO|nr:MULTISPECIES: DUF1643 domain-containing protein [Mycobacterium]QNI09731.1 DUF1643 domain-containing protein [Mycobacterium kubicae]QNI15258.1 DUF1643 domain-containing protein [Mycobacterium kubicae]GFG83165.1 hypothetical protein MPRG_64410 [Mycobacterium paragordonae]